jgi:hypothetical protein
MRRYWHFAYKKRKRFHAQRVWIKGNGWFFEENRSAVSLFFSARKSCRGESFQADRSVKTDLHAK